jgi:hypothetical protein
LIVLEAVAASRGSVEVGARASTGVGGSLSFGIGRDVTTCVTAFEKNFSSRWCTRNSCQQEIWFTRRDIE